MTLQFSAYDGEDLNFWIDNAYRILDRYDGNGKTFIDVGAHLGIVSILAVTERGFDRAIAIEALPANYRKLIANISTNECSGKILPIWAAISDDPPLTRKLLGYIPGSNSGTASLNFGAGPVNIPVATLRMSNIYDIIGFPDFLKVDIEGGEWPILDQLDSKYIDIEVHTKVSRKTVASAREILEKKYDLKVADMNDGFYGYKK